MVQNYLIFLTLVALPRRAHHLANAGNIRRALLFLNHAQRREQPRGEPALLKLDARGHKAHPARPERVNEKREIPHGLVRAQKQRVVVDRPAVRAHPRS